jgi:hypothetical protein
MRFSNDKTATDFEKNLRAGAEMPLMYSALGIKLKQRGLYPIKIK